jgi:hypothetical protein
VGSLTSHNPIGLQGLLRDSVTLLYFTLLFIYETRDNDGLRAEQPGLNSWQVLEIFLYSPASRPTLGPTQYHIQWVPAVPSSGLQRPDSDADCSSPSAEVKNTELYLHSPIRLRGLVLN